MIIGLLIIPIVGTVGLSTDAARGYLVKHRLTEALDAAGLAAARESESASQSSQATMFFNANWQGGYLGATIDGPHTSWNQADDTVTVTATATVPTTFTRVLGFQDMEVAAASTVQRTIRGMELILVMDNTGSMRGGGKMTAMIDAAESLIDILYENDSTTDPPTVANETLENFWVGLVPYSASVNIGSSRTSWLETALDTNAYLPTTWKGCVEARDYPLDTNDTTYVANGNGFTPTFFENHIDNYWADEDAIRIALMREFLYDEPPGDPDDGDDDAQLFLPTDQGITTYEQLVEAFVREALEIDSGDPLPEATLLENVERVVLEDASLLNSGDALPVGSALTDDLVDYLAPHSLDPWPPTDEALMNQLLNAYLWRDHLDKNNNQDWWHPEVDEANGAQNDGTGPNLGCGPAITPLVDGYTTIMNAIGNMQPWHRGGTTSNLGLAWGWRAISPNWTGLWGDPNLPLQYNDPLMQKVVILLTDGNNEVYDWPGDDLSGGEPRGSDYTGYGRVGDGRVLENGTGNTLTNKNDARNEVDRRMAEICTAMKAEGVILYTMTFQVNNTATNTLFENCATTPDHFFPSPSNADLMANFQEIGEQLSQLRISR